VEQNVAIAGFRCQKQVTMQSFNYLESEQKQMSAW